MTGRRFPGDHDATVSMRRVARVGPPPHCLRSAEVEPGDLDEAAPNALASAEAFLRLVREFEGQRGGTHWERILLARFLLAGQHLPDRDVRIIRAAVRTGSYQAGFLREAVGCLVVGLIGARRAALALQLASAFKGKAKFDSYARAAAAAAVLKDESTTVQAFRQLGGFGEFLLGAEHVVIAATAHGGDPMWTLRVIDIAVSAGWDDLRPYLDFQMAQADAAVPQPTLHHWRALVRRRPRDAAGVCLTMLHFGADPDQACRRLVEAAPFSAEQLDELLSRVAALDPPRASTIAFLRSVRERRALSEGITPDGGDVLAMP